MERKNSYLLDDLEEQFNGNYQGFESGWYYAKPIQFKNKNRFVSALRVLFGKSFAVHFKENENGR